MATQTTHYNLIKPSSADRVAVGDLNDNSDTIDGYLYQANERADQIADDYNTSSTYNTGDYCRRENYIYRCNSDSVTGNWDSTKWDRVKVMESVNELKEENDDIWVSNGVLGAKNLVRYPYDYSTVNNRGIDFTANNDGSVDFEGTPDNASTSAMTIIGKYGTSRIKLKAGTYIVSGGSDEYGGVSIYFYANTTDSTAYSGGYDGLISNNSGLSIWTSKEGFNYSATNHYGHNKKFTIKSDAYINIQIRSANNSVITRISGKVYPMLRLAEDNDDTYQPYAMTNNELTNVVNNVPTTAGTYTLQAVRNADNTITYSWV